MDQNQLLQLALQQQQKQRQQIAEQQQANIEQSQVAAMEQEAPVVTPSVESAAMPAQGPATDAGGNDRTSQLQLPALPEGDVTSNRTRLLLEQIRKNPKYAQSTIALHNQILNAEKQEQGLKDSVFNRQVKQYELQQEDSRIRIADSQLVLAKAQEKRQRESQNITNFDNVINTLVNVSTLPPQQRQEAVRNVRGMMLEMGVPGASALTADNLDVFAESLTAKKAQSEQQLLEADTAIKASEAMTKQTLSDATWNAVSALNNPDATEEDRMLAVQNLALLQGDLKSYFTAKQGGGGALASGSPSATKAILDFDKENRKEFANALKAGDPALAQSINQQRQQYGLPPLNENDAKRVTAESTRQKSIEELPFSERVQTVELVDSINREESILKGITDTIANAESSIDDIIKKYPKLLEVPVAELTTRGTLSSIIGDPTDVNRFLNYFNQYKSQMFMLGFQSLKGGGQITEKEGAAAAAAMDPSSSTTSLGQVRENMQSILDKTYDTINNTRNKAYYTVGNFKEFQDRFSKGGKTMVIPSSAVDELYERYKQSTESKGQQPLTLKQYRAKLLKDGATITR